MKPVELEIFLQDGVSPGLKKAGQTLSRFSDDAKAELREVPESLNLQKSHVSGMEKEYARLEKALKNAAPGKEWMEAKARLAAYKAELDGEKTALQQLEEQQRKLKAEAEGAGQSLRQQLKNVREEIATLLLAYRSLTEAERQSAQGRELARHIDELTEKAGELNDAIADTSQAITNAASDTRSFDQLAGGVQLVVDGFGLATAGAQALGLSEADLVEVQTRLQTALVASNALTSMQVNLQKQSALMQGVNAIQTKAAATAETIRTWAVGRGVIATKAATIAQAAFNAVAKANPYVLLAMAVVTVVGALYAFAKGSDAAKKAEESRKQQLEKSRQAQEEFANKVGTSAAEQIASFIKMKKAWEGLGDSFDRKRRFIHETREAWKKLGKEIRTVNEAEDIFKKHTGDVIDAIVKRALVKGYQDIISEQGAELAGKLVSLNQQDEQTITSGSVYNPRSRDKRGYAAPALGEYNHGFMNSRAAQEAGKALYVDNGKQGGWHETYFTERGADLANAYALLRQNHSSEELRNLSEADMIKKAYEERIRGVVELSETADRELQGIMERLPGLTVDPKKPDNTPKTPTADNRLDNERRMGEELRKLLWQNEQEEIDQMAEGAEKRRRQIALDFEKEMAEIDRQRQAFAAANTEAGVTGLNAFGLTEEQQTEIDRANRIAVESRDRALEDMYRMEAEHMADYLKEYGTFQQKRTAIAEEYDRKIAEASDEWSRKTLEREKAAALQNVDIEAIRQSIDWGSVFGDFGTLFRDQLEPTIEKLRAITRTEEFRNTDIEDKQTLYELIARLEQANTSWDSNIFATLGDDLTHYQEALRNYIAAQDAERAATDALAEAKKKLAAAEASGDNSAVALATRGVTVATNNLNDASAQVTDFGTQVQDASGKLQTSTATVNNMFSSLANNLAGLKSGSLQGVGESLMGLDKLFNNSGVTSAVGGALAKGMSKLLGNSAIGKSVAEALGNSGLLGQIISAILSILDMLKDGIGALVSSLIDTVLNAVSGIIENLLNGQMFVQIGRSVIDGVGGILDALTFGGFTSLFDTSNGAQVQETMDRLTDRNARLQTAIEDLTDEIKAGKGSKSVSAYKEAYNHQNEVNQNYLGMAQAQAGYHGSHHSWEYYFEGFTQEQISRLSRQMGKAWDGSLWSLTPEQMKLLRGNVDMWEQIRNTGKGGYGDRLIEKLNNYIAQAGKLETLTTQLYEGLTGMTFDSMYDSFVDTLLDMEATTEDFADNISEYFMRAMLSNKIGELYADKLEEWWNKFGKAMEDNDLTEAERKALSEEYMKYVEDAMRLRDQLAAATGYDKTGDNGSSQAGRAGSFNALSQDQGTKLEGLFVSVQGYVANIDTMVEDVVAKMNAAEGYLARIAENTESNAASAEEIKELILQLIRDGIKTK